MAEELEWQKGWKWQKGLAWGKNWNARRVVVAEKLLWHCRGQSQSYTNVLSDLNICFVVAYTAEALLKNTAVGPWKYIKDNW